MPSNLHPLTRACAAAALLALLPPHAAVPPCPPEAAAAVTAGWKAYRTDSIAVAGRHFRLAERLCPENLDARVGLGYVALREDRVGAADSLFHLVVRHDSLNGDAWDGLTLSASRRGDRAAAVSAGRRAIRLHPDNATTRSVLSRLDPDWDRPASGRPPRPETLRVDARTQGDAFQVPQDGGWRGFYVNGVNMGVALPGKFPSEFPPDSATYAGWFDMLSAMHANTVRLYTILPPSFYRALRSWNQAHSDTPLWLVQGVWTELPPEHHFNDTTWKADFRAEMRRVVDLLHGNASIPKRPGHAGGRYDADLSRWVLAYIVGREWEPYAVKDFDQRNPSPAPYHGRFLETTGGVPAADGWMAEQCDYLLGYEANIYNTIRPIAYTNWPTLDPLTHVTEASGDEETAWRRKAGRLTPRDRIEYENDAIQLDAMLVRATPQNPAGWFASYHAYPYYPDFLLYDPGYDSARSSEGRSNFFGYLVELKRHHAGMPLLLSEYGVPSSRGVAHLQPQGWHHGGHDEIAMARIDARLTREIRESGAAGGIIFAWIDEWFKKNWIVVDYERPLENTRQWHNAMDAEQHYGILGMFAGIASSTPQLGGMPARWRVLPTLTENAGAAEGQPSRIRVGSDESYVYVAVEFAGLAGQPFPWKDRSLLLALDSYRAGLGQLLLPGGVVQSDVGFEFAASFRDTTDAELRIAPGYSPYVGGEAIVGGDDYGRFGHRPITTVPLRDGRFDSMFVITNRARFARDGRFIPASGYNRGRLRYGTVTQSSLSDWWWDAAAGMLQLRLPWGLINVSDPSTRTLLYERRVGDTIGTATSDGMRFGVLLLGRPNRATAAAPLLGALPVVTGGRWRRAQFPDWTWPTWTEPRYFARLKPVYDSLREVWGSGE